MVPEINAHKINRRTTFWACIFTSLTLSSEAWKDMSLTVESITAEQQSVPVPFAAMATDCSPR